MPAGAAAYGSGRPSVRQRFDETAQLVFGPFDFPRQRLVSHCGGKLHVELQRTHCVQQVGGALELGAAIVVGTRILLRAGTAQRPA
jgi:hypothetical protein